MRWLVIILLLCPAAFAAEPDPEQCTLVSEVATTICVNIMDDTCGSTVGAVLNPVDVALYDMQQGQPARSQVTCDGRCGNGDLFKRKCLRNFGTGGTLDLDGDGFVEPCEEISIDCSQCFSCVYCPGGPNCPPFP